MNFGKWLKKNSKQVLTVVLIIILAFSYLYIEDNKDEEFKVSDYTFYSESLKNDHFKKHGIEMGYENAEDYVYGANLVISNPKSLHKLEREDGDDVYYLEETNEFVILSQKGYIRTYFEPSNGLEYYNRQ